jgi:hypothetical protein
MELTPVAWFSSFAPAIGDGRAEGSSSRLERRGKKEEAASLS